MKDDIQLKIFRTFIRWLKNYNVYSLWVHNIYFYPDKEYTLERWFEKLYKGVTNEPDMLLRLVTNAPFQWNTFTEIKENGFTIVSHYTNFQITNWAELNQEWSRFFKENKAKIYGI